MVFDEILKDRKNYKKKGRKKQIEGERGKMTLPFLFLSFFLPFFLPFDETKKESGSSRVPCSFKSPRILLGYCLV